MQSFFWLTNILMFSVFVKDSAYFLWQLMNLAIHWGSLTPVIKQRWCSQTMSPWILANTHFLRTISTESNPSTVSNKSEYMWTELKAFQEGRWEKSLLEILLWGKYSPGKDPSVGISTCLLSSLRFFFFIKAGPPKVPEQPKGPTLPHACDPDLTFDAITTFRREVMFFKGR